MSKTVVMSGGVGAAKFLRGLSQIHPPESITAIINVADDFRLHGLAISPDIDSYLHSCRTSQPRNRMGTKRRELACNERAGTLQRTNLV
jgi:hypothetical protein